MDEIPDALTRALSQRYDLRRVIGRGGMATVYLAEDRRHDRPVAVKVMHPELAASIAAERFLQEIGIVAKLTHPHILVLIDSGQVEGSLYYVMPFVKESLRGLLTRRGVLRPSAALDIIQETADAVGYAHRRGIIHRDIKPENILLAEGHALVADFGIARAIATAGGSAMTRTGFPIGTLGYMSPEQAAGRLDLDERTDIYSLACVYYEAVIGEPPGMWVSEESGRMGRFLEARSHHRERLDLLPGSLEFALVRAMQLRPERRYLTTGEMVEALEDSLSDRRRFSETEAREIVRQASVLEANPVANGGVSLGGLQQIAAEAGIAPEHVFAAAKAIERPLGGIVEGGYLGYTGKVELEQTVEAEMSSLQHGALLEEIRYMIGRSGQVNETLNDSLFWEAAPGSGDLTPRVQVSVSPRKGRTRIRIVEDPGADESILSALSVVFGSLVSMGAGAATYALGADLAGALVAAGAVWGSQYIAVRAIYQKRVRKRFGTLTRLMNRLTGLIESGERRELRAE